MSLTHFAAPCQQLFSRFREVFFHRSGEVVFVSAVCEATQSSTACQQLFSTFRFFLSLDALLSSRGENLFVFALAVNNFFQLPKNSFLELFVRPSSRRSLCACQTLAPSVRFPLPSGARSVYGLFPDKGQEVFSSFSKKMRPRQKAGAVSRSHQAGAMLRNRFPSFPDVAGSASENAARPTGS